MTTERHDNVRREVEKAYTEAITRTSDSCCTTNCCTPASATPAAEQMGYSKAELDEVPDEAASSSFGCGNPLAFAGVEQGQTVVDLGSGAGLDLLLASRSVGPTGRVIGIDMTDAMIETARANIAKAGVTNVEVRKGIIEDMPVDDESVDWVISNCVINLSPEKDRVFAEISRVLKPGGTMQVSDIVAEDLPEWARGRTDLFTACVGGAISEAEYLEGLRAAGLGDVEVTERVILDTAQIRAVLESQELSVAVGGSERIVDSLAGKIASVKVRASKPATA
jgi:ubiquinone/menaquinone biosynthesis C-methylase UbiE